MSGIVFIMLGVAACGFTRDSLRGTGVRAAVDLCLGVLGAVVAGAFCNHFVTMNAAGFIASGLVAIAAAAVLIAAHHVVLGERPYRSPHLAPEGPP